MKIDTIRIKHQQPKQVSLHLAKRIQERVVSAEDVIELKQWIRSRPRVPFDSWFKRFDNFTLVGKGGDVCTVLTKDMEAFGKEVIDKPKQKGR